MKPAWTAVFTLVAGQAMADCAPDQVRITGDFGEARFAVDLADDPEERAQGLMFVEEMGRFEGMLFVYERPRRATFWMRNTLIPLDMIFADATGTVQSIHRDAVPMDETTIDGGDDILAVLEVNAGMTALLGIAEGDVLQHPAFGDDAAVPCDG